MGVNLKDVNTIIHYGAPRSIEDYFQESGRGGRSGGDAVSTVYWKPRDCPVHKKPATLRDHELIAVSTVYWKPCDCPVRKKSVTLRDHELIAVRRYLENSKLCRRVWLLDHFDVK